MAWVLDSGKFQHRVHELHSLGAEDKLVIERDGQLFLSATNPTLINEKFTASNSWTELQHGDLIQIGRRKIRVSRSSFFFSGPLALLFSGAAAMALLVAVASAHDLSGETIAVLFSAVILALAVIQFYSRKRFWSFRATGFNLVFALLLSAIFCEGMLRFADSELHVSHERVPASLVDSP